MLSNYRNNLKVTTMRVKTRPNHIHNEIQENFIEKYLQSILKPLNMMQALFFCAKYKIEENFITPNSLSYDVISAFGNVIYICGSFYLLLMSSFRIVGEKGCNFVYSGILNDVVVFLTGSLLSYFTNVFQKTNNVLLVCSIQNVHRILKINETIFSRSIICNWIYVITLNVFHIFWMFYYSFIFNNMGFTDTFNSYLHICFDVNILYAARIMQLNWKAVTVWIENVLVSRCVEDESSWNNYFKAYMEIIQSYQLVEKTFQYLILFYNLYIFSNALMDVAIHIEARKITIDSQASFALQVLSSQPWLLKSIILQISLSVECERFYSAMGEVQLICSRLETSSNVTGASVTQKRVCKNIQRVRRATFKKMNVCGLFITDATQPLHFFYLVTTYIVVLIQFSFK